MECRRDCAPARTNRLDVTVRLDNAALAQAAVDNFGPRGNMSGSYGYIDQFDSNGNDRLDGQEVFPAYAHVLSFAFRNVPLRIAAFNHEENFDAIPHEQPEAGSTSIFRRNR